MPEIKVEYINPFLMSAKTVVSSVCGMDVEIGKPYIKQCPIYPSDTVTIMIGLTGEIQGQTVMAFDYDVACFIASKMMMMPVDVLDDIPKSAISELGNMIMGNAATIFSTMNIGVDITPPIMMIGKMDISNNFATNICIPIHMDKEKTIEINVSVKNE